MNTKVPGGLTDQHIKRDRADEESCPSWTASVDVSSAGPEVEFLVVNSDFVTDFGTLLLV